MEDFNTDAPDETVVPSDDMVQEASETLDDIEAEVAAEDDVVPNTPGSIADADNYLVTQASIVACLGITCEVVDNLAGNGLSLAMACGKIPDSSDIRRIVSKALHTSINDRTISFSNAASMGDK